MNLNEDFTKRVVLHSDSIDWMASPMPGVERRMLDRIGAESARATTIVRFAKDSTFSAHTHVGGEEFLVLDGVFQDEKGDYPAGVYIRNPPQSRHTPGSEQGCTIFVKLQQFAPEDRTHVTIDTNKNSFVKAAGLNGISIMPLFRDSRETVCLETWLPDSSRNIELPGGAEILVLEGSCKEGGEDLVKNSWLRLPAGGALDAIAGPKGVKIWIKTGHLAS